MLRSVEDVFAEVAAPDADAGRPVALFVSPHLDDVAFSCGGVLVELARAGWAVHLCTAFTASVDDPEGFALACQLDKGLSAEVDYMALRRAEDDAFAVRAGAHTVHHLPFPEAPHRGYGSAEALFGGAHPEDETWQPLRDALAEVVQAVRPATLFAPQGLGGHVDHVQTIRAVLGLPGPPDVFWYRDAPYAFRNADAAPTPWLPPGLQPLALDITGALDAKADAIAAYRTQLGFQFGGEAAMRTALADFARQEAARFDGDGAAEVVSRVPLGA